jgi:FkbM family methyltransferase
MKLTLKRLYRRFRREISGDGVVNFRNRGIVNFIDVGSVGKLPAPWNAHAQKIHHLLKFEPRDRPLYTPNVTTLNVALWSDNAELDFYIYEGLGGSGSSLFRQNIDYVRENFETLKKRGDPKLAETWFERSRLVRTERLVCRKLDDVLSELQRQYHFAKIDAQGAEYEILRGAEGWLRADCLGLQLELFTLPLYQGIPLLPEVREYLRGFGFEMVKQYPAHGTFDSQHDCVFLKTQAVNPAVLDTIRGVYGL